MPLGASCVSDVSLFTQPMCNEPASRPNIEVPAYDFLLQRGRQALVLTHIPGFFPGLIDFQYL
jgi:hypothetical protein